MTWKPTKKVVTYPSSGYLLVVSELQGNLDDFMKVEEIFREKEIGCV